MTMPNHIPLAERMRPKSLEDYVGQQHLVGQNGVLRKMLETGKLSSFILWGPPGVGKTTLAKIISATLERPFYALSAINSGVKEVREVIQKAKSQTFFSAPRPVLFIDEIHRFSKAQQDSLLGAVEQGVVTLIGATTENPSFEVISALLSRCQVYVLKPMSEEDSKLLIAKALEKDRLLSEKEFIIEEYEAILRFAAGDGRKLYNILELLANTSDHKVIVNNAKVEKELQTQTTLFDKGGEMHYDIASAFIKSIRGSDADAAVYWLARMLEGGEDPKFIARRLLIAASEDIGLANPNALLLANACFDAVNKVGMPESRIILSETTIYLATSLKSNAAYEAINKAQDLVRQTGNLSVPLHLRNAPTKLMKTLEYGKEYKYAHAYEGNYVQQQYLPDKVRDAKLYMPQNNPQEQQISQRLNNLKKKS